MASPIPKFPDIVSNLKQGGFVKETNFTQLRLSIMRITATMKDETIKNIVFAMRDLGYIKQKDPDIWYIMQKKPYNFIDETIEEEKIDKILDSKIKKTF